MGKVETEGDQEGEKNVKWLNSVSCGNYRLKSWRAYLATTRLRGQKKLLREIHKMKESSPWLLSGQLC